MMISQIQDGLGTVHYETSKLQEEPKLDIMSAVPKHLFSGTDSHLNHFSQVLHKHGRLFMALRRQLVLFGQLLDHLCSFSN